MKLKAHTANRSNNSCGLLLVGKMNFPFFKQNFCAIC